MSSLYDLYLIGGENGLISRSFLFYGLKPEIPHICRMRPNQNFQINLNLEKLRYVEFCCICFIKN